MFVEAMKKIYRALFSVHYVLCVAQCLVC